MNRVFICYARADGDFVDRLQAALDEHGIRVWRDIHDAEAGPLSSIIERAITQNPVVVLVLSSNSVSSGWVNWEIETALTIEERLGQHVLCPVAIDDSWLKELAPPILSKVKRYNVLDMSGSSGLASQFPLLLEGLKNHYRSYSIEPPISSFRADALEALQQGAKAWDEFRARWPDRWHFDLRGQDLSDLDLSGMDMQRVDLSFSDLTRSNLEGARFSDAVFGGTSIVDVDLSKCIDLSSTLHFGSSDISTSTLVKSKGLIPDRFLTSCGLADWEVQQAKLYAPDLQPGEVVDALYEIERLRNTGPIQINPIFLSYAHTDANAVEKLHVKLQDDGIRSWRDKHDLTAGPIENRVDRALRINPMVVLVLSEASVESDWVAWEIRNALELRRGHPKGQGSVLCPIALDDAWKDCAWPGLLRKQIEKNFVIPFHELGFEEGYNRLKKGLPIYYTGKKQG